MSSPSPASLSADAGVLGNAAQLRSSFSEDSLVEPRSMLSHARIPTISAAIPSYLKRLDISGVDLITHPAQFSRPVKAPRLTLTFSSSSFLDATLTDEEEQQELYVISTRTTTTNICRSDPWNENMQTAAIKWPVDVSLKGKNRELDIGTLVQTPDQGGWLPSTHILHPASRANSPRKFHIPGYSRAMKWKQHAGSYWCVSPSTKGPVAVFEPAYGGKNPRLLVYETLYSKHETRPLHSHRGVFLALLDSLVLTSMLLVTDAYEWMVVGSPQDGERSSSPLALGSLDLAMGRDMPSASVSSRQLRKIMYGEPMIPRRTGSLPSHDCQSRSRSISSLLSVSEPSPIDSEEEYDDDVNSLGVSEESDIVPRLSSLAIQAPYSSGQPSPSAQSSMPSLSPTGTEPTHNHLDPTFYNIPRQPTREGRTKIRLLPQPPRPGSSSGERVLPRAHSIPPRMEQETQEALQRTRNRSDTTSSLPDADQSVPQIPAQPSHRQQQLSGISASTSIRRLPVPPPVSSAAYVPLDMRAAIPNSPPPPPPQETLRPDLGHNRRNSKTIRSLPPTPQDSRHGKEDGMPWNLLGVAPPPAYSSINFQTAYPPVAASTSSQSSD